MPRTSAHLAMLVGISRLGKRINRLPLNLFDRKFALGDASPMSDILEQLDTAIHDPELLTAAHALRENRLAVAEAGLRARLRAQPTDVAAIRMLAEVAGRLGRYTDAEKLLRRALEIAPDFAAARINYATVLHRQNNAEAALEEIGKLLMGEPNHPGYLALKAAVLCRIGDYAVANRIYADVLARHPAQPKLWMSYGHALKTVGSLADSITAYREALTQSPHLGEAWWSLANLKTIRFAQADVAAMQAALLGAITDDDRLHIHFALGKAFEDSADYAASFSHYDQGNVIRRAQIRYDASETTRHVERCKSLLTPAAFASRAGRGCTTRDPIFIVGLPRSGSTLIEQILASHSAIEGTMELPNITSLARELSGHAGRKPPEDEETPGYLEALLALSPNQLRDIGQGYIERTRVHRHSDKPFFIDKMPNNFAHIGLIDMILPNATIIDARRHPLGCGFSCYKQHFARGQSFTYRLDELGAYYRDYTSLMDHFDQVLPGRVHRVFYEKMVSDTEGEVRRLLDFIGLPFEQACLTFHANNRAVRTASSEQVRQPITAHAVDHWHHYDRWMKPLRTSLKEALITYPFK